MLQEGVNLQEAKFSKVGSKGGGGVCQIGWERTKLENHTNPNRISLGWNSPQDSVEIKKGLYVTQGLLTGLKVKFLAWQAKANDTKPASKRTELSHSHRMS
jgi:hypothetical protein